MFVAEKPGASQRNPGVAAAKAALSTSQRQMGGGIGARHVTLERAAGHFKEPTWGSEASSAPIAAREIRPGAASLLITICFLIVVGQGNSDLDHIYWKKVDT